MWEKGKWHLEAEHCLLLFSESLFSLTHLNTIHIIITLVNPVTFIWYLSSRLPCIDTDHHAGQYFYFFTDTYHLGHPCIDTDHHAVTFCWCWANSSCFCLSSVSSWLLNHHHFDHNLQHNHYLHPGRNHDRHDNHHHHIIIITINVIITSTTITISLALLIVKCYPPSIFQK